MMKPLADHVAATYKSSFATHTAGSCPAVAMLLSCGTIGCRVMTIDENVQRTSTPIVGNSHGQYQICQY